MFTLHEDFTQSNPILSYCLGHVIAATMPQHKLKLQPTLYLNSVTQYFHDT